MDKYRKMKKVTIEELREGDEIIVASGSKLKYLKLLKNPSLSNKQGGMVLDSEGYFTWDNNFKRYKSILCSTAIKEVVYKFKSWGQNSIDRFKAYKQYIIEPNSAKHNKNIYVDLNSKEILLIKRKEQ